MGKQINYWMEYDSFLLVAKKALDLGCTIFREDIKQGTLCSGKDLNVIIKENNQYYFYLPQAGEICITESGNRKTIRRFGGNENVIIEAGYSYVRDIPQKEMLRARLYCSTGYYDSSGKFIYRPECLTKVYDSLARYVKKIAPYTEITDIIVSSRDEDYGQKRERKHKEYITDFCLEKRNSGYKLRA